jgi:hypothetical protein
MNQRRRTNAWAKTNYRVVWHARLKRIYNPGTSSAVDRIYQELLKVKENYSQEEFERIDTSFKKIYPFLRKGFWRTIGSTYSRGDRTFMIYWWKSTTYAGRIYTSIDFWPDGENVFYDNGRTGLFYSDKELPTKLLKALKV